MTINAIGIVHFKKVIIKYFDALLICLDNFNFSMY